MRKSKERLSTKSDEKKGHEGQRDAMKNLDDFRRGWSETGAEIWEDDGDEVQG